MSRCQIFIDESGDFGFSKKSSNHITLCAIITSNKIHLERIPLKVRKYLKANIKMKPELKFHGSNDMVKKKILGLFIFLRDTYIACIVLNKNQVAKYYQDHKNELFDQMCSNLLEEILRKKKSIDRIDIWFDIRPRNKPRGRDFDKIIEDEVIRCCQDLKRIPPSVIVSRISSEKSKGLQVADFIAGAIQRKYEHNAFEYYNIISNLIIIEKVCRLRKLH